FDAPVMETNCTRRVTSATATQALAILNSAFFDAQARTFAKRARKDAGSDSPPAWIETAYRLALSRPPTAAERSAGLDFLKAQAAVSRGRWAGSRPCAADRPTRRRGRAGRGGPGRGGGGRRRARRAGGGGGGEPCGRWVFSALPCGEASLSKRGRASSPRCLR